MSVGSEHPATDSSKSINSSEGPNVPKLCYCTVGEKVSESLFSDKQLADTCMQYKQVKFLL